MGDESCRKHERGIMQEESWKNPGGEPWKTYLGCTVMEETTRKRSHAIVLEGGYGGDIKAGGRLGEQARRNNPERAIMKESWKMIHGKGNIEDQAARRHGAGDIMKGEPRWENHGIGITRKESLGMNNV